MGLPFLSASRLLKLLRPLLDHLLPVNPIMAIQWLADALDTLRRLRDKVGYHGMYEILDYDATLEFKDPQGTRAVLTRRQVVRFLQNKVRGTSVMRDHW